MAYMWPKAHPAVSFYGEFYCGDCDLTWEFAPEEDGTEMYSFHECSEEAD